ncbi:hypothetical protein L195_g055679 [Trifolium pratense]|uniref:Uncharacterized protein n=1 Tax=Trifolium pratense TaxID=57577 RepID=A0A2K3KMJ1_TRIPR|nr:hypothetical protein L195_g055679 [Trifolium pratense]
MLEPNNGLKVVSEQFEVVQVGISCHGCKVCDDSVQALVGIDARYTVISIADELSEKANMEVAP